MVMTSEAARKLKCVKPPLSGFQLRFDDARGFHLPLGPTVRSGLGGGCVSPEISAEWCAFFVGLILALTEALRRQSYEWRK